MLNDLVARAFIGVPVAKQSVCVSEMATSRKEAKFTTLQTHYDFQPINESVSSFQYDLDRRISLVSGEDREPQLLFQRISVAIQRFNAVLLLDGFCRPTTRISVCSRL